MTKAKTLTALNGRIAARTPIHILSVLILLCSCAPLAYGAWGPSGNVVPNVENTGPPLSCLPPLSRLNLEQEFDVFDKLIFNQIISLAVAVTYDWMMAAGWNFDGSLSRSVNKMPYADYTGYTPKNSPWELPSPCNWQPLHETDGRGKIWIQTHLMPYGPNVRPFFVDATSGANRTVPMWNCSNTAVYKAQVDEVLRYSASLNDTTKMIAEIMGPQPFTLITNMKLRYSKNWSITDVMAFNLMSVIMIDLQGVVIGREKLRHDSVRPASAVRYFYGTTNITAYARGQGTQTYRGKDWLPYLSTFNEAEFPSGAVCWCTVLNEWIELWQGGASNPDSNKFKPPLEFTFNQGCSIREPFATPTQKTSFTISTTQQEYIQYCKDARVIGGVHFRAAVDAGQEICSGVTGAVWGKLTRLYPKLKEQTC